MCCQGRAVSGSTVSTGASPVNLGGNDPLAFDGDCRYKEGMEAKIRKANINSGLNGHE